MLTFTDGSGFSDRLRRVFRDEPGRSRAFINGLAVAPTFPRLARPVTITATHARVRVSAVALAVEHEHGGRPGFILESENRSPLAWVPAASWEVVS